MDRFDNLNYLRANNKEVYERMKEYKPENVFEQVKLDGRVIDLRKEADTDAGFIHGGPDQLEEEAEKVIAAQKAMIKEDSHVLFFGTGLGYHIEKFIELYPNQPFSIYEPSMEIFHHLLQSRSISFMERARGFILGEIGKDNHPHADALASQLSGRVTVIPLPSYELLYPEDYADFLDALRTSFERKRLNLVTLANNQMNWIRNSIINFPTTFTTPNILKKKSHFQNKPAIIVAAGPSLHEELENLRYIKENRLAYIFAVGSANKPLIQAGIYPDAVCSFEPQSVNQHVFKEIVEREIKEIPMIFGSSICHQTLTNYPGQKFHVLINTRDPISRLYAKNTDGTLPETVNDAYSIAIVAYQMLMKLGSSPIILAGQNLAFRKGQYYAKGISYDWRDAELSEEELKKQYIPVEDVNGEWIETDASLNEMRILLENYIEMNQNETINTTKGGAKIKGTSFVELIDVIHSRLKNPCAADEWIAEEDEGYSKEFFIEASTKLEKEKTNFFNQERELLKGIEKAKKLVEARKSAVSINHAVQKLNGLYKGWTQNYFYKEIASSLNPLGYEVFAEKMKKAREITLFHKQRSEMIGAMEQYIKKCYEDAKAIDGYLTAAHKEIGSQLKN
ncbi:motility associated factor glycosyltransferase family protein [Falsibacillus pallidus]|uniref:motility associated factor glycosyltransferase family protein n=1 Tax=Falsibacillus pallidus TaxID=493781 RepID=UPI003D986419